MNLHMRKKCIFALAKKRRKNMFDASTIRVINDFPTPGIKFYDITTLLNDGEEYHKVLDDMIAVAREAKPDVIVALESRGFFFGPVLAYELNLPFVPVRKAGKLPFKSFKETYDLEYGTSTVEMHIDAIKENQRVLIIDDVLATGGSMNAAIKLVEHAHPSNITLLFLMELSALKGRQKLGEHQVHSLMQV